MIVGLPEFGYLPPKKNNGKQKITKKNIQGFLNSFFFFQTYEQHCATVRSGINAHFNSDVKVS
jgi:hypothetical protein